MKTNGPKYKNIYMDILTKKYPEKIEICHDLIKKVNFSFMDILDFNKRIFGESPENITANGKFRSYSRSDILGILDYQKKNQLNDSEMARHFNLSRSTLSNWKKRLL